VFLVAFVAFSVVSADKWTELDTFLQNT